MSVKKRRKRSLWMQSGQENMEFFSRSMAHSGLYLEGRVKSMFISWSESIWSTLGVFAAHASSTRAWCTLGCGRHSNAKLYKVLGIYLMDNSEPLTVCKAWSYIHKAVFQKDLSSSNTAWNNAHRYRLWSRLWFWIQAPLLISYLAFGKLY